MSDCFALSYRLEKEIVEYQTKMEEMQEMMEKTKRDAKEQEQQIKDLHKQCDILRFAYMKLPS